ncbi:hypothetical protein LEN26_010887 [Aphanomyces euteiches]|nr:hypothetical protein LEN26_010887 [Aphanomyces euteiches]
MSTACPTQYTTFTVYGILFKVDVRYQFIAALGRGSYGTVCSAKDLKTGEKVAIKRVSPMARKQNDAKHTLREICLMQSLGAHPNIVGIKNLFVNVADDELYIVMDFMDTDMHRVIQSSQMLSESHYKYFLHQILRGVKHMHDNGVLHRDLKPGNILVTKNCQIKIADFGLARSVPKRNKPRPASAKTSKEHQDPDWQPMTEHVVTRWYRAPELMLQPDGQYSTGVDMWSVGCIFAEILGRKAVFPGKNFIHQLTLVFDVIGTPSGQDVKKMKSSQAQRFIKSLGKKTRVPFKSLFPTASADAIDLLERLLQFDPVCRYTVDEALAHPYMQGIDKRYAFKDLAVRDRILMNATDLLDPQPANINMLFESQKLSKNDLVKLIQQEVAAFHGSQQPSSPPSLPSSTTTSPISVTHPADATQTPAGIRTIHALSKQSANQQLKTTKVAGRVTCQNPELMKTMLAHGDASISTPSVLKANGSFSLGDTHIHQQTPATTAPPDVVIEKAPEPPIVQVVGVASLLSRSTLRPTSAARVRSNSLVGDVMTDGMEIADGTKAQPTDRPTVRPTNAARTRPPIVIPTTAAILADDPSEPAHDDDSSSSSEEDTRQQKQTAPPVRPKSAPIRAQKPTCVGSTASLMRSTRTTTKKKPIAACEMQEAAQENDVEPSKKGKKLTVPVSPKFSVMSWQKPRPGTAKPARDSRSKRR